MLLACRFDEPLNLLNATICSLWLPDCHLPEIVLMGTRIGGQLNLTNATLSNPGGIALNGDGLTVGQHLVCRKLKAEGTLLFRTAHIGGQLSLTDAALSNPKGSALHGNRLTVGQDMFCHRGSRIEGATVLSAAQIKGVLGFVGVSVNTVAMEHARAGTLLFHPASSPERLDLTHAQLASWTMTPRPGLKI